jgi:hypothetical protein
MKNIIRAAIGLALAGLAASASAYSLSPPHTKFQLNGKVLINTDGQHGQGRCSSKWSGRTGGQLEGEIRTFKFVGDKHGCNILYPQAVPARIVVTGPSTVSVSIGWFYQNDGECNPTPLNITVSSEGIWSFNGPIGRCNISGTLTSTPPVTIVP